MAQKTKIEWTDRTWNPVRGCSRVSEGCRFCYAEGIAARFNKPGQAYEGLARRVGGEARWTGKVRLIKSALTEPLSWRQPQRVFVNSMSDLFHEELSDDDIDQVFTVMAIGDRHAYQVLTKRPARMREYLTPQRLDDLYDNWHTYTGAPREAQAWPLPNVWCGTSIENRAALSRLDELRETLAAVRFLSIEPLIEDLGDINLSGIHWVIVGGESGRGEVRPMHPEWVKSLRDQCVAAGVPFFFKQWGNCLPCEWDGEDDRGGPGYNIDEEHCDVDYDVLGRARIVTAHGREFARFPHKKTGRLLDGRTWDEFPKVAT